PELREIAARARHPHEARHRACRSWGRRHCLPHLRRSHQALSEATARLHAEARRGKAKGAMPGLDGHDLTALFEPVAGAKTLALAVSGGPDSLALMLLAHQWSQHSGTKLVVYSLDHGLRPEAANEVAMVLAEAGKLGLEARGLKWDGEKPETGIQASARK